jgi:transposase
MRNTRSVKTYDQAFRDDAVAFLERSKAPFSEVAASLGIPTSTLYSWYRLEMVKKAKKVVSTGKAATGGTPETAADKLARLEAENEELRKRVASLEEDKVILKKFAAFSVREKA